MNGTGGVSRCQVASGKDNQPGDGERCGGVPASSGDTATHGGLVGPLCHLESFRTTESGSG